MILTLFAILTKGREEFEQVRGANLAIAIDVRGTIAACDELACAIFHCSSGIVVLSGRVGASLNGFQFATGIFTSMRVEVCKFWVCTPITSCL